MAKEARHEDAGRLAAMRIPIRVIVFVVAATALFTLHTPAFSLSGDIERRVETLLRQMTLDEKIGQLSLVPNDSSFEPDLVRQGRIGAVMNFIDADKIAAM